MTNFKESNETIREAAEAVVERPDCFDPRIAGAVAGAVGGLFITGLTGRTSGKVIGTVAATAAGYYLGGKIEDHVEGTLIEKAGLAVSVGVCVGYFGAGIGACLDANPKPVAELY